MTKAAFIGSDSKPISDQSHSDQMLDMQNTVDRNYERAVEARKEWARTLKSWIEANGPLRMGDIEWVVEPAVRERLAERVTIGQVIEDVVTATPLEADAKKELARVFSPSGIRKAQLRKILGDDKYNDLFQTEEVKNEDGEVEYTVRKRRVRSK